MVQFLTTQKPEDAFPNETYISKSLPVFLHNKQHFPLTPNMVNCLKHYNFLSCPSAAHILFTKLKKHHWDYKAHTKAGKQFEPNCMIPAYVIIEISSLKFLARINFNLKNASPNASSKQKQMQKKKIYRQGEGLNRSKTEVWQTASHPSTPSTF